jgi:hypothetical protein
MSPSTATAKAPQALKLTAALAATSGALHQTLLAVVRAQGVNGAAWLDQLEAQFVRNAKNMTFTGCAMDAEAGAVEAAPLPGAVRLGETRVSVGGRWVSRVFELG